MVRIFKTMLLAGGLAMASIPASAAILTLPFVGDVEHPDLDPFHMVTPEAPAAAAPAKPAPKKKHHRRHEVKKKKA